MNGFTSQLLSHIFLTLMLCACAVSETEPLRQARFIQQEIERAIRHTDSLYGAYTNILGSRLKALQEDTLLHADTILNRSNRIKLMRDSADKMYAQLADWKLNMKKLPCAEEIAKGAANPFGEGADDRAAYEGMMKQQTEYNMMSISLHSMCSDTTQK